VAKAALESSVKYLANDLGPMGIRINAISAGPIKTFSTGAISNFREKLKLAEEKSPLKRNISGDDVGYLAAFLCGQGGRNITGCTIYVDSGIHIIGA